MLLKNLVHEPLMSNRWIIKLDGVDIPEYLFQKYELFNNGEEIIFKTQFYETVNYSVNPKNLFNITKVTIEYLDPTGIVVNGLSFFPKGINFNIKCSYKKDNLHTTKLRIVVDNSTLVQFYKNNNTEEK